MEFGLKGTSRLVADVTGSRHSGLGFTVFWLFMAVRHSAVELDFLIQFLHVSQSHIGCCALVIE